MSMLRTILRRTINIMDTMCQVHVVLAASFCMSPCCSVATLWSKESRLIRRRVEVLLWCNGNTHQGIWLMFYETGTSQ
jgi:hypothetical protein